MALVTVSSILGRSLVSVKPDATVEEAARLMRDYRVGSVLVMEGDRLAGILTERDLAYRVLAEGRGPDTRVSEVMTRDVVTIRDNATLAEAARLMLGLGIRHLPVIDAEGKVVGVLSLRDLAKAIWGSYEPPMTP